MFIRGHYVDPVALGNEQVLMSVGQGGEKQGLGEEEESPEGRWEALAFSAL